jgi:hypothetical protein
VLAEFCCHPGKGFEHDGQAVLVVDRVLAGGCLACQRFGAWPIAPQLYRLSHEIQHETAHPKLAAVLAHRQTLLTDFYSTVSLSVCNRAAWASGQDQIAVACRLWSSSGSVSRQASVPIYVLARIPRLLGPATVALNA